MSEDALLRDKKEYEISFVLSEESGTAEVEKALRNAGAEMSGVLTASAIRLAYPIKKHENAYFGFMHFSAMPDAILKVKSELAHNPKVLRLLVLTPPVKHPVRSERVSPGTKPVSVVSEVLVKPEGAVSNEALEKKLEEILK